MRDITRLLNNIDEAQPEVAAELLPLVYDELKKLAAAKMSAERGDHTLQATALVHEAYLRLVGSDGSAAPNQWNGRGHFFAAAAEAMRRILVDHARDNRRLKRGGDADRIPLDALDQFWNPKYGDILDLNEALDGLQDVDPQAAEMVKLCCFAGQTQTEAAALMGVSLSTAKRYWVFARAWLHRALQSDQSSSF
jgi:RNA polymerase sigma factor (TIGR02999 family)